MQQLPEPETKVTYEDLQKAALIEQKIYFMEREILYHGLYVTCIRMLDQDDHEVKIFDPGEENGVSANVPDGIQPQFCHFEVSVIESRDEYYDVMLDGEGESFPDWRTLSLKELHELWASCL